MQISKLRFPLIVIVVLCGLCLSGFLQPDLYSSTIAHSFLNAGSTYLNFKNMTTQKVKQPYDAVIMAYMRSGSTFIGKILGHRKDTFYWNEPFWTSHTWEYLSSEMTWCNYGRSGCKHVEEKSLQSANKSIQYLLELYTCTNLDKHYNRSTDILQGETGATYRNCKTVGCKDCPSPKQCEACMLACFVNVTNSCDKRKHRVAKVLRLGTTHAQSLLENHKRLKLVQIVRDPRAVMNSRNNAGWYYTEGRTYSSDAETLCNRMEHDIESAERLRILFPDRVKIIQYEDFSDPYQLAVSLYSFLNMDMTTEAHTLINKLMKSGRKGKDGFHPDSYRKSLPWNAIESTNKWCFNVFKKLGLRVFENREEYKDMNLSVILNTIPYSIDRIKREP